MSDPLAADDAWSTTTADDNYWYATPSDNSTSISESQYTLWDCIPQIPVWMTTKPDYSFPLEKLPSEILYIMLQHMINDDYKSIEALKSLKYAGINICHRCRSPWECIFGVLPDIFYAAPQVLSFSLLSKFTRELVMREAKTNPKIKEIFAVSHSFIRHYRLTFNNRNQFGDGEWLCSTCVQVEKWDIARMFYEWRMGWESWMKSEGLWS